MSPELPIARSLSAARYLVGIDGGGTGTRARLQDLAGHTLGEGSAGPSGLSLGIEQAWQHVEEALAAAFAAAGTPPAPRHQVALGLGLAGACVATLRQAFVAADPGYAACVTDSDAITQLVGGHAGTAGIVVAAGTGSVAAVQDGGGVIRVAGGWGFPVGDQGGGAWLGLRAVQATQAAFDGRGLVGPMTEAVRQRCGASVAALQAWCRAAGQHAYAQLAPLVFDAATAGDGAAEALLLAAADELACLVDALQPVASAPLPIVVSGSIGTRLVPRWPAALRQRVVPAAGDSADGALRLLHAALAARGQTALADAEQAA